MTRRTSPQYRLLLLFASVLMGTAFMLSGSYGADSSQKPLSFSNKDLEPYENTDAKQEPEPPKRKGSGVKEIKAEGSREQKEKEHWFKRASQQKRKIQRFKDDMGEKEQELAEENRRGVVQSKKTKALNKEIAKIRKRLKNAEGDLSFLEDEAHRKGIPPGWLRCQFE